MFVELHILQNFVPSNLNRDDTNAPKDCEFGGYRRARISSQCFKRAIRTAFSTQGLLPPEDLAVRTKRLARALVGRMTSAGQPAEEAERVAEAAISALGLKLDGDETQYLLFLGDREIDAMADVCLRHWDTLREAPPVDVAGKTAKQAKQAGKENVSAEVGNALKGALNGGQAADLALFGRMLVDLPARNVDAASQVAHAISTNRVSTEFDFFTAVDDLKAGASDREDLGAGMLGTVEFNSACFYRYANLDTDQLLSNLAGNSELARRGIEAFLRAAIMAIPTGKQNSMAAHNLPSLVFAVIRDRGLENLANAFLQPVEPDRGGDLVANSVRQLGKHYADLRGMYGDNGLLGSWVATTHPELVGSLAEHTVSIDELVKDVTDTTRLSEAA